MWKLVILGCDIFDRHGVERRIHPFPRELFDNTGPIMFRLSGEHDGYSYQAMWGKSLIQVKAAVRNKRELS